MKHLLLLVLLTSCISTKKYRKHMCDYQVELHMDTAWIYDRGRLVGKFIHINDSAWTNPYDSIFLRDNQ